MKKLSLLLWLVLPVYAFSQGFQVNLEGQKQIGMGHTGTGVLQDGASLFFNPGAVVMLPENYVQAGISPLLFKSDFVSSGSNTQYQTLNKIATPFNFYGTWGPKASWWKVGLAIYTPFGGLTDWGDNWTGKYVLESLDLKTIYFQPTVSIKLTSFLSVGAGFVYNDASVDLTQAIPLGSVAGQDGQGQLKGNGHGYGWNAGVYLKVSPKVTIGLTHRSQVNTTFSNGTATFSVPASVSGFFPQPNSFSSTIALPATNSVGVGYYPTNKLTLAFDANLVGWNVYKTLAFNYATTTAFLQNEALQRNYKDAVSLRLGGQYKATDNIFVRAGGGFATTAVNDGYVTPDVPDANRIYFTGGLGYKAAKHLDVDVSFEFEHIMQRTQTNIQSQLSGTFKTDVYIPGVSLAYHW